MSRTLLSTRDEVTILQNFVPVVNSKNSEAISKDVIFLEVSCCPQNMYFMWKRRQENTGSFSALFSPLKPPSPHLRPQPNLVVVGCGWLSCVYHDAFMRYLIFTTKKIIKLVNYMSTGFKLKTKIIWKKLLGI